MDNVANENPVNQGTKQAGKEVDYEAKFKNEVQRRRGMLSDLDKTKHENLMLKKKLEAFEKHGVNPQFTPEQQSELDDLQNMGDLDGYYSTRRKFEEQFKSNFNVDEETIKAEAEKEVNQFRMKEELDIANSILASDLPNYNEVMSEDALQNDVPPRIKNKFLSGELSALEYLQASYKHLSRDKQIANPANRRRQPNLGNVVGGSTPSQQALDNDVTASYENLIF